MDEALARPAPPRRRALALAAAILAVGLAAVALRFARGLGATTGLSDTRPWGLWIVADLVWIALASGAFATGAVAHVLGKRRYEGVARRAVLLGLLAYAFVVVTLLADLGLPWHGWRILVERPESSAMFEVAWCVALYLVVLSLEVAPAACERLDRPGAAGGLRRFSAPAAVAALAAFTGLMAHSLAFGAAALALFWGLALVVRWRTGSAEASAPVLLAIAAVVLSTMHQSSLGSLFLLVPQKMDPLWWSPILPVHFLLSAVAAGFATVVLAEAFLARSARRPGGGAAVAGIARLAGWALWIALAVRLGDLAVRGRLGGVLESPRAGLFLLEVVPGAILPAAILSSALLRARTGWVVLGATLAVLGLVLHRLDVVLWAVDAPGPSPGLSPRAYVPSAVEIASTAAFFAATVLLLPICARALRSARPAQAGPGV